MRTQRKHHMIILPCDCHCSMFVIEKSIDILGGANYNITVQDSRYDHNCNSLWSRLKNAFKVLFGKPVYFNDVYLNGEDTFRQLLTEMEKLTHVDEDSASYTVRIDRD